MPRLTPYAAHEIAMVSSAPAGSGFPIGLMPGALPSDHASRQTLKTAAVRLPLGHSQFAGFAMPRRPPRSPGARHISCCTMGKGALCPLALPTYAFMLGTRLERGISLD